MNDIQYRVAVTGAQIADEHTILLRETLDGLHMTTCEIHDMDVITHARAIRCIIIVTEDIDLRQLTDRYLCHVWKQVVRDALWILTDETGLVRTDRVEVTKQDDIPLRICRMNIGQNLLLHPLGPAIRISAGSLRAVLRDRNLRRIAVHRRRAGENDVLAAMRTHLVGQIQRRSDVRAVILNRLVHGLTDGLQTSEVNNRVDLVLIEDTLHRCTIHHIIRIELHLLPGDLLDPVDRLLIRVIQVIDDDHIIARVQKLHTCMASDISSTTCYKNCHNYPPLDAAEVAKLISSARPMPPTSPSS